MDHDKARQLIGQQFTEGTLPALPAQALRAHLRGCAPCRQVYDRTVELERTLEGGVSTPAAQEARLLAAGVPQPQRRSLAFWALPALAAAAALVFLVLRPAPIEEGDPGLQARGGTATGRQAWIALYVRRGEEVRPLEGPVAPGEGLLFAWTNLKESKARYLAIAGRDAGGRVRWFHPAYEPGGDPRSLAITSGEADRELPEVIRVEAAAGRLEICALFTEAPLVIKEIDTRLERGEAWPPGSDCHVVEVKP